RAASFAARFYQRGREPQPVTTRRPTAIPEVAPASPEHAPVVDLAGLPSDLEAAKVRVHRRLIQELETSRLDRMAADEARNAVAQAARHVLTLEAPEIFGLARDEVINSVTDEVLGLGPIEPLLRDPGISEVMVNAPDQVFIERSGKLTRSGV